MGTTNLALSKVTLVSPITLSPSLAGVKMQRQVVIGGSGIRGENSGERWATRVLHSDLLWLRINVRGLFQVLSAQWKLATNFIATKAAIIANRKTQLLFDASLSRSV